MRECFTYGSVRGAARKGGPYRDPHGNGFRDTLGKGPVAGYPVVGVRIVLTDGSYHEVDSSDRAFQTCAQAASANRSRRPSRSCWNPS
jgi:translation elongation factor EF-G